MAGFGRNGSKGARQSGLLSNSLQKMTLYLNFLKVKNNKHFSANCNRARSNLLLSCVFRCSPSSLSAHDANRCIFGELIFCLMFAEKGARKAKPDHLLCTIPKISPFRVAEIENAKVKKLAK